MGVEELSQGGADEPSGLGPAGWVGIALIGLVVGGLLLSGRGADVPSPTKPVYSTPVVTFSAVPIPGPSVQPVPDDPGQSLNVGVVCQASTDGRTALRVSFTLANIGSNDVTLLSVKPLLPLSGLRPIGPTTAGGSCSQPGTESPAGLLPVGEQRLFTMRFRLPKACPQPLPVQATVRLRVNQMTGTTTVPVFDDLGSVTFDTCP